MKIFKTEDILPVILTVLCFCICISCGHKTPDALSRAESLMEEHPDSALSILENTPVEKLVSSRDRALHALLLTQARDKNYRFEKSDSLINIAVAFFGENNDIPYSAMSFYYRACVYYNGNNYIGAVNDALSALDRTGDPYWQGRIHALLGDIYHNSFNHNTAIEHFRKSVECFDRAGNSRFSDFYRIAMVNALSANGDTREAVELLDSMTAHAPGKDSVTVGLMYSAYIQALFLKFSRRWGGVWARKFCRSLRSQPLGCSLRERQNLPPIRRYKVTYLLGCSV